MAPHNRRGKAKEANNKEKRAKMFNQRPHTSHNHHSNSSNHNNSNNNSGSTSPSYLSSATPASERLRRFLQHQRTNANDNHNNNGSSGNQTSASAPSYTYDEGNFLDVQIFDYIIVVDVEATCISAEPESNIALAYPHEVIEFPAILIDVRRGTIDKAHSFHAYVKPIINPTLSSFCTELTGITQDKVDEAEPLAVVLEHFVKWFTETIPKGAKVVFAADGPWDFRKFFVESHAIRDSIPLPTMFYEYIDIRTTFANVFHHGKAIKLDAMLRAMKLEFEGRPHCGFDDAYNIARLAVEMMRNGCIFDFLVNIPLHSKVLELPVPSDSSAHAAITTSTDDGDATHADDVAEETDEHSEENNNRDVNSSNIDEKNTECPGDASKTTKKRKAKAKAKEKALLESESSKLREVVKETRPFYYAIPGYPVYRRAEGSGHLDKDVVDDIAKNAFGTDYFTFGERHQQEVREYRQNASNSSNFNTHNTNNKKRDIDKNTSKKANKSFESKKGVKCGESSKEHKGNSTSLQNYLIRAIFVAMVCIIMLLLYCAYLLSSMRSKAKL